MGHENETVGDCYSKMKEDIAFRLEQAETVGLGFELPPKIADVVRIVRRNEAKTFDKAASLVIQAKACPAKKTGKSTCPNLSI